MKKIKWAVILIAALSIMFAGCTGGDPDKLAGNTTTPGKIYLQITKRDNSWDGVDIKTGKFTVGDTINVYVTAGTAGFKLTNYDGAKTYTSTKTEVDVNTDKYTCTVDEIASDAVGAEASKSKGLRLQANEKILFDVFEIEVVGKYKMSTDTEIQAYAAGTDVSKDFTDRKLTNLEGAGSPVIKAAK
jgi:hypothetical protein